MKNRRCTDCIFAILFLAFAGACGYVCIEGFTNGNPHELLSPVDYDGMICGVNHTNHPFLYFLVRPSKMAPGAELDLKAVCVSSCPLLNTTEPIDGALINELTEANFAKRIDFETGLPTDGFVGYGTKPILNKFCVPNL